MQGWEGRGTDRNGRQGLSRRRTVLLGMAGEVGLGRSGKARYGRLGKSLKKIKREEK